MPNLNNKKMSEIHKSVLNLGGSNNGVASTLTPLCDGSGYSTGIEIADDSINMNLRRGVLSNYVSTGSKSCLIYKDMSFPNTGGAVAPTAEQSKFIADIDRFAGARIHFTRDDFIFKIAIRSKYFDQGVDGEPEIVGYWLRGYGGIKYFLVTGDKTTTITQFDNTLYTLHPVPNDDTLLYRPISGLIKKNGVHKGMRHPHSCVEFKFILSCEDGLDVSVSSRVRKIRDFEGNDIPYASVSSQLAEMLPLEYEYITSNFEDFEISSTPTIYTLKLFNPTLWVFNQDPELNPIDLDDPCIHHGKEALPNVDFRLYGQAQGNIVFVKS